MYRLPQAGLLAQELLEQCLAKKGYLQSKTCPGLGKHVWRPITFSLIVDDFGVKYFGKEHADHLIQVLQMDYEIFIDWTGSQHGGLTIDWDYSGREVHLSMPGYVDKALQRFQHVTLVKPENQPFIHTKPACGAKIQYAKTEDTMRKLDKK